MIERWELIQAQSLSDKHRHKQNLQQWQQLISDLQTMRAWLGQSEAELNQLRGLELSTDIHTIQQRIKKLKVCLLRVCECLVSPSVSEQHKFVLTALKKKIISRKCGLISQSKFHFSRIMSFLGSCSELLLH